MNNEKSKTELWEHYIERFSFYLKIDRALSPNTIESYTRDIKHLAEYSFEQNPPITPTKIETENVRSFLAFFVNLGISSSTQARLISGIRAFFNFLVIEDEIKQSPVQLLETPRLQKKIPEILSTTEIDNMLSMIDLSKPEGHRNKAIIETLYSCGLRVSELINLKISNLYFDLGFIKVTGKGNKQRLVPISKDAIHQINLYIDNQRIKTKIDADSDDILFLNRRGKKLTRVMIFYIVKQLADATKLTKVVSPHTFRHSFATHLVENGANLRAVQEMLGHESIITTEIYTHLDVGYLRNVVLKCHPMAKNS